MKAAMEPNGALAIFERDAQLYAITPGGQPTKIDCDVRLLTDSLQEFELFPEDTTAEGLHSYLERRHGQTENLALSLIALDDDASVALRSEAIELLNRQLSEAGVVDELEAVLYSEPIAAPGNPNAAAFLADSLQCGVVADVFRRLIDDSDAVVEVGDAWNTIPSSLFQRTPRSVYRSVAVRRRFFVRLARAVRGRRDVDLIAFDLLADSAVQQLPGSREISTAWLYRFRHAERREPEETEPYERRERQRPVLGGGARDVYRQVVDQKDAIRNAITEGDEARARLFLRQLIEFQQASPDGGPYLAKSLCDLAMFAKALGHFELQLELSALSTETAPEDPWTWAQLADGLMQTRRYHEALDAYERLKVFGNEGIALQGVAQALRHLGRLEDARRAYLEAVEVQRDDAISQIGLADTYRDLGQLEDSRAVFERLLDDDPGNTRARAGLARVFRTLARTDDALRELEKIPEAELTSTTKVAKAAALRDLGEIERAQSIYEEVVDSAPWTPGAAAGLADVYRRTGRMQSAMELFDSLSRRAPWLVEPRNVYADTLRYAMRFDEALAIFDETTSRFVNDAYARLGRAETLKRLTRWDEAALTLGEMIRDFPWDRRGFRALGDVLLRQRLYGDALDIYDAGRARFPASIAMVAGAASALGRLGRRAEALALLRRTLVGEHHDADGEAQAAQVLSRLGDKEGAISFLEGLVAAAPWHRNASLTLARLYRFDNRLEEALQVCDRLLATNPADRSTMNERFAVLVALQRDDAFAAVPMLPADDALPRDEDELYALHLKGLAYLQQRQFERARELFSVASDRLEGGDFDEVFRAGFALALLYSGDLGFHTLDALQDELDDELSEFVALVRLHLAGLQGDRSQTKIAMDSLANRALSTECSELLDELERRFVLLLQPTKADDWLLEREIRCLLVATAPTPVEDVISIEAI
jgi:tetratricopeptide (TPR) repeat protein